MDSATLSSISTTLGILAPACMGGLFVWVALRTRSRHTLFYRMWQLIHGSQEISDPEIRAYVSEQNSLMTFRFIAGVPVRTLESAHHLIQWTKLRDVDMFVLRIAGDYFDPDLRQIRTHKLPYRITQWTKASLVALSVPLILVSASIAFTNSAVLKFKMTGTWFLMTATSARSLWPPTTVLIQKDSCQGVANASAEQSGFTTNQVTVLCEIWKDEITPSYIDNIVKKQRSSSVILIIATLAAALILLSEFTSGYVAARLARRKLDPALSGDQLILDLNYD